MPNQQTLRKAVSLFAAAFANGEPLVHELIATLIELVRQAPYRTWSVRRESCESQCASYTMRQAATRQRNGPWRALGN